MRDWRILVDTGGTFTDGVAAPPDGGPARRVKILSTGALRADVAARLGPGRLRLDGGPDCAGALLRGFTVRALGGAGVAEVADWDPAGATLTLADDEAAFAAGARLEFSSGEEAPLVAARLLTGTPLGRPLPPARLRLATTLGTNLVLERAGAPVALFVTRGLGDLPAIGDQTRPDLFALRVERPAPLAASVTEVDERIGADGQVLRPIDLDALAPAIAAARRAGLRVAAVALLHAWRNDAHEAALAAHLRAAGFEHVSRSADLAPRIRLLPRLETACVDAHLAPRIAAFLRRVGAGFGRDAMLVMTSAGGLVGAPAYRACDSLLSGPAGGVVGAAHAGRASGFRRVIGFDMGGTSTDVARIDDDYEYVFEHRVGDARLAAPALAIETVAAGGGSVCALDDDRLVVGPRSTGADPGPACYGAGGPLCLTDVNLLLGRLDPERFGVPLSIDAARRRLTELLDAVLRRTGERPDADAALVGLVDIADARMADAIRRVSVRRGYDPADSTLVAFGGAGGQHACGVAERLGMRRVLVPPDAALLSAVGLGHAVLERFVERQVLLPLADLGKTLPERFAALDAEALEAVEAAGAEPGTAAVRRRILHLRFAGQDSTLDVDWRPDVAPADAFATRYRELYGHLPEARPVELESMRVVAATPSADTPPPPAGREPHGATPVGTVDAVLGATRRRVPVFDREALAPGAVVAGPALVREAHSSLTLLPGWTAHVDAVGGLVCERADGHDADTRFAARPAAVRLELFTQRFRAIVREMGERLERTAVSTNVKERLDFSCALLDARGRLVANAPHIPVHLGALGLCVRRVAETLPLGTDDVAVTNHPAYGGSHLPDVTVITPVFEREGGGPLLGWVASRAHHAEIGGSRPGSMPPRATRLADEGVVIAPTYLVRHGVPRWDAMRRILADAALPSRAVEDNLADLRAAVAANHAGAAALQQLAAAEGRATTARAMERLAGTAAARLQAALVALGDGTRTAVERLDDGTPLAVRLTVEAGRLAIDFAGTGDVHPGNLNATPAIVRSVVLYVMRLLIDEPLPLNEGLLRHVTIDIPRGSLLDPDFGDDPRAAPAVVGGNVETSQRLVDSLLRALGLSACSQGTMNNVIFGDDRYGYYETLGGGCGAGPTWDGASAVHSHMTNTRITDPEILEQRYPVRVERFAIRRGSGGAGAHRGGDGLVRALRFLAPASVSLLTQHRVEVPYGLHGGRSGAPGLQRVVRADGRSEALGPIDDAELGAGDLLVVETPGGGGWGEPTDG